MNSIKLNPTKTLLAMALFLSGSFAQATPTTAPTASVADIIWLWLLPAQQSTNPGKCNDYPECAEGPPVAPQPKDETQ